jgi:hypothetical protein
VRKISLRGPKANWLAIAIAAPAITHASRSRDAPKYLAESTREKMDRPALKNFAAANPMDTLRVDAEKNPNNALTFKLNTRLRCKMERSKV